MKTTPPLHTQPARGLRRRAFTLVEMLLVLSILALLAGLVLPKLVGQGEKARKQTATTQLGAFKTALDLYEVQNGGYPKSLNDCVVKPRNASSEWTQVLDKVPLDPWEHPYIYVFPGRHNPTGYDLSSAGPDGTPNNDDDIRNWETK